MIYSEKIARALALAYQSLELIHTRVESNRLSFNASKTQCLAMTGGLGGMMTIEPEMDCQKIPLSADIKSPGVHIDHHLRYNTISKAREVYNKLHRITSGTWGANPEISRDPFVSAIKPLVTYASPVWSNCLSKKAVPKLLLSLQRIHASAIAKCYRTVPLNSALVLSSLEPIDLKL